MSLTQPLSPTSNQSSDTHDSIQIDMPLVKEEEEKKEQQHQQQHQRNQHSNNFSSSVPGPPQHLLQISPLPEQSRLHPQTWSLLPSDILHLTSRFLDGRSLSRLQCVDRFSCGIISKRNDLWQALVKKPWRAGWLDTPRLIYHVERSLSSLRDEKGVAITKATHPREYFIELYTQTRQMREIEYAKLEMKDDDIFAAQRGYTCRLYEEAFLPPIATGLLCVFMIWFVYQLETRDSTVNYASLWPLLLFCLLLSISTCNICYVKWRSPRTAPASDDPHSAHMSRQTRFLPDNYYTFGDSMLHSAANHIGPVTTGHDTDETVRARFTAHFTFGVMLVCSGVWLVLLTLRVTSVTQTSWIYLFIPLYIVLLLVSISPWLHWWEDRLHDSLEVGPIIISLPWITFVVLLVIYLSDVSSTVSNLSTVFMPLYIFDIGTLIYPMYRFLMAGEKKLLAWWVATDGLFLAWKIMLMMRVDRIVDIAWPIVFIPFYPPLFVLFLLTFSDIKTAWNHITDQRSREVWNHMNCSHVMQLDLPYEPSIIIVHAREMPE